MPNETYQKIMEILDEQRMKEVESAMVAKRFMKRTLNPIKLIGLKRTYDMFMYHANGIGWAMGHVRKEFEP
ncbi:hypothetical protein D3Z52_16820 [Clostridiaceae bacterium]|nr:hypothetical protein [Clostridiaceae bacterium]